MGKPFKRISGVIRSTYPDDLFDQRFIVDGENEPFMLMIQPHTRVLNNAGERATLKKGDSFEGYIVGNKPVVAFYPPLYSPDLIIVQTNEMGKVRVDEFNEQFVNISNDLKIDFHEDVVMVNLEGDPVTQNQLVNELVAVFYTPATISIPAQTTPKKIILLDRD